MIAHDVAVRPIFHPNDRRRRRHRHYFAALHLLHYRRYRCHPHLPPVRPPPPPPPAPCPRTKKARAPVSTRYRSSLARRLRFSPHPRGSPRAPPRVAPPIRRLDAAPQRSERPATSPAVVRAPAGVACAVRGSKTRSHTARPQGPGSRRSGRAGNSGAEAGRSSTGGADGTAHAAVLPGGPASVAGRMSGRARRRTHTQT